MTKWRQRECIAQEYEDLLGSVSDVAGKVGNAVNWAAEGVRGLFGGIGGGGEGGELRRALR